MFDVPSKTEARYLVLVHSSTRRIQRLDPSNVLDTRLLFFAYSCAIKFFQPRSLS